MTETLTTFEYRDRQLGDTEGIVVATSPRVFYPTSTTNLLLRTVRRAITAPPGAALDLGCGCGIVAITLAKRVMPEGSVAASDISEEAVRLAERNAADNNVTVECRQGSLFEPWAGRRFDLIVDDVSGMAEEIARSSPWYPPHIPSDAGPDGTRWIGQVLAQAPDFLSPRGRLIFPVLTLSDEKKILEEAHRRFRTVRRLDEQWYPLNDDLLSRCSPLHTLAADGTITVEKRGSRWWWATRICLATDPA